MATEQAAMAVLKASRPTFRNAQDKAVFALHSAFLAAGFSLCAVGPAADDTSSCQEEVGIDGWNEMEGRYAFLYCKEDQGVKKRVLVKVLAFGDSLLAVDAVDLDEQKEPFHLKIKVEDFVSEVETKNYGEMYKNFKGLIEKVNSAILDKVEVKNLISKNSEKEEKTKETASSSNLYEHHDYAPYNDGIIYPSLPAQSGHSDLFPGPGAGFYPSRGGIGGIGDGGMLIGPDNPMFFPSGGRPGPPGIPPGIVPGSRYDPIGPPDVPGFEPSRFVRRPRNLGGHPDLEHFQQGPDFL